MASVNKRTTNRLSDLPTYVSEPTGPHRYSIIILHGRGDNGPSFGRGLVDDDSDEDASAPSLRRLLPGTRFLFPTAAPLPSARFKSWKLNQWFDFWSLFHVEEQPALQNPGLRENAEVVEALIEEEAEVVGIENVILGGISNGAAQAMITVLLMMASGKLHHGHQLGGLFGLCGWLPYAGDLEKQATGGLHDERTLDGAQQDGSQVTGQASSAEDLMNLNKALRWISATVRDSDQSPELINDDPKAQMTLPVFLGHGSEDGTVPKERFEDASRSLKAMDFDAQAVLYDGLEHWYSDDMISDLARWIKDRQKPSEGGIRF